MDYQVLTSGRRVVFTGSYEQCEQYMDEAAGNRMGFWIDRVIVRCQWCRWPISDHCCTTRENMPKGAGEKTS